MGYKSYQRAVNVALAQKQINVLVTQEFLNYRYERAKSAGFHTKAKWVEFCEAALRNGFEEVYLYEAKHTKSKYITVVKDGKKFKVRFSDHKPIAALEAKGSCDFFVGRTNLGVTNTSQAFAALWQFFNLTTA